METVEVGPHVFNDGIFKGVKKTPGKFGMIVRAKTGLFGAAFFPYNGELYVHNICGNPTPKLIAFLKETAVKFARRLGCKTVSVDIEEKHEGYANLARRMGFIKSAQFSRLYEMEIEA